MSEYEDGTRTHPTHLTPALRPACAQNEHVPRCLHSLRMKGFRIDTKLKCVRKCLEDENAATAQRVHHARSRYSNYESHRQLAVFLSPELFEYPLASSKKGATKVALEERCAICPYCSAGDAYHPFTTMGSTLEYPEKMCIPIRRKKKSIG